MDAQARQALMEQAARARQNAYAPYSGFSVGAALLTADGSVYIGCNVENASFSPTCCAERVALFSAVAEGKRDFSAIAVIGGREQPRPGVTPCGVCRQVLAEFCSEELPVLLWDSEEQITEIPLGQLLPLGFQL